MVRSCLSRSSSAYLRRAAYSRARDLAASRACRCRSSCSLRTQAEHAPVAFVVASPQRLQGFVRRCFRTLCVIGHPMSATRNRMISQFALSLSIVLRSGGVTLRQASAGANCCKLTCRPACCPVHPARRFDHLPLIAGNSAEVGWLASGDDPGVGRNLDQR